jgi:Nucleotidyltransferase
VNREGYLVDLIKPLREPPWKPENQRVAADAQDLLAAEIEALAWHENAPPFEAVAIDEKGEPCRMVATDPRVWAAHKLWLSQRPDREPLKRRNDEAQARAIGQLVAKYLSNLPYVSEQLRILSRSAAEKPSQIESARIATTSGCA